MLPCHVRATIVPCDPFTLLVPISAKSRRCGVHHVTPVLFYSHQQAFTQATSHVSHQLWNGAGCDLKENDTVQLHTPSQRGIHTLQKAAVSYHWQFHQCSCICGYTLRHQFVFGVQKILSVKCGPEWGGSAQWPEFGTRIGIQVYKGLAVDGFHSRNHESPVLAAMSIACTLAA